MDKFNLAPGYFVQQENSISGKPSKTAPETEQKTYEALLYHRRVMYYLLAKVGAKTPYGFFVNAAGRKELEEKYAETAAIAEEAAKMYPDFKLRSSVVFTPADPKAPGINARVRDLVVDALDGLVEDLKRGRAAVLQYTQDPKQNLALLCAEPYGALVRGILADIKAAHRLDSIPADTYAHIGFAIDKLRKAGV